MENIDYTRLGLGLGVVLVLLALFYWAMRAFAGNLRVGKWRPGQRIGVVDVAAVDGTRRLVIVRRDNVEHLLMLGPDHDTVIETGIPVAVPPEGEAGKSYWPSLRRPGRNDPMRSTDPVVPPTFSKPDGNT